MIEAVAALFLCTVTDDAGHTIQLEKPARRVISLAPDITENLFAAGAGQYIIGAIQGSDYPPAAQSISIVGSYAGIDLEKIISLHPDLIVTWSGMFPRQLIALKKLGIPIYVTQPKQLEDIPRTLKNIGCLAGTEKIATIAAANFTTRLDALRQRYQTKTPVSVFYQIGAYSLLTINKDSWINQVITLCGGQNSFATVKTAAPEVSWEAIITANPSVVLSDATNPNWKTRWQRFPSISAVKHNHLYTINPDTLDRASPRLLEGVKEVCGRLHPQMTAVQKIAN